MTASNPLANLLVIVVGTLVIAASVVLGFFAFVLVASVVLVLVAAIRIRLWWLGRFGKATSQPDESTKAGVIEGEFSVVADDRDGE